MLKQKPLPIQILITIVIIALGSASVCTLLKLTPNTSATNNPIDIEIIEMSNDGSGNFTPWQDITGAMPGQTYSAVPQVINHSSIEVNVRICLTRSGQTSSGIPIVATTEHIIINPEPNWTKESDTDCYKYNFPLASNAITDPLFNSITIGNLNNEHQDATFNLHIYAEATGDIPTTTPDSPDTGFFTNTAPLTISVTTILSLGIIILIIKKSKR